MIAQLYEEIIKWATTFANTGNGLPWLEENFNDYCRGNGYNDDSLPPSDPQSKRNLFRQRVVIDSLHGIHGHGPEDFRQRVEKLDDALLDIVKNEKNNMNNLKR